MDIVIVPLYHPYHNIPMVNTHTKQIRFTIENSGSLTTVIPKYYCQVLGIKNDLLVLSLNGKQITIEKGFVTPDN